MLTDIKLFFINLLAPGLIHRMVKLDEVNSELVANLAAVQEDLTAAKQRTQQCEDMLANRNAGAIHAQAIYVTQHALHRYRERIGFNGTDDELRKMIYKLTLRHLATLDRLPDGHYKINDKAAVRIADNTVQTVVKATRKQS